MNGKDIEELYLDQGVYRLYEIQIAYGGARKRR